jgi:hypothetical protein
MMTPLVNDQSDFFGGDVGVGGNGYPIEMDLDGWLSTSYMSDMRGWISPGTFCWVRIFYSIVRGEAGKLTCGNIGRC